MPGLFRRNFKLFSYGDLSVEGHNTDGKTVRIFKVLSRVGNARSGVLQTAHGSVETPILCPLVQSYG